MQNVASRKKQLTSWGISILVCFLLMLIPTSEQFTPEIRLYLALTISTIMLIIFDVVPKMFLAILLPSLYTVTNLVPLATAFSPYASANMWMVIGALYMGNVMEETGVLKRICYKLVSLMGGSFLGAVIGAFISTLIINIITFGSGWVVALPVIIGLIKALDLKPGKKSALICFAGITGAIDTGAAIYIPGTISIFDTYIPSVDPTWAGCSFFTLTSYNWGIFVVLILSILLIHFSNKRSEKRDHKESMVSVSATKEYFNGLLHEMGKMSANEWKSLVLFLMIICGCVLSNFTTFINSTYCFMIIPYLAFVPVIGCAEQSTTALKKLNLDGVFFYVSMVAIGTVGTTVGFNTWLANASIPLLEGKGTLFTLLLMFLIAAVGHLVLTPGGLLAGLGGSFAAIAGAMGIKPIAALCLLNYAGFVMFLPHQVAGYLMLFGMGYWPMKEFVKHLTIKSVLLLVVFVCIMYPVWNIFSMV